MKLPELKKRFNNKYVIRIVAGVLMVGMLGTSFSAYTVYAEKGSEEAATEEVSTEETTEDADAEDDDTLSDLLSDGISVSQKEIGKEETVYVISDSKGNAQQTIVSDHLINNDDKDVLEDASTLKDIENVKGDETFTQDGNKLTWQADGNDIYYQGTSTGETPVTQKITYYLDGEEIEPEDLAGKSGKVTMRFDYTNNEKVGDVYVPFAAISGMILDDSFTDVQVTNGKVMSDGNTNIVVGYALPGLKDSLELKEGDLDDVDIPDYFEVSADVENFSLDMTMTLVVNAANYVGTDGELDLSSIDDLLDTLTDATSQLEDGSAQLAEGLDTLQSNMKEFSDGVSKLQTGIKSYTEGASTLASGIGTLSASTGTLSDGVTTLNSSAQALNAGISLLNSTVSREFTEAEKNDLMKTVSATVAAQKKDIENQAAATIKAQKTDIENQAAATVAAQKSTIEEQASAGVTAQADSIKSQVDASVDEQAATIQSSVSTGVEQQFDAGLYAQVKSGATDALNGNTDLINVLKAGITPQVQQGFVAQVNAAMGTSFTTYDDTKAAYDAVYGSGAADAQVAASVSTQVAAVVDQLAGSVADTTKSVSSQVAAGAAVSASKSVAEQAAVTAAESAAKQAAVSTAEQVAKQTAVSTAEQVAKQAAYQGASSAAGQAAVSAAEAAKQTVASSITATQDNGYSLVTGAQALAAGTQQLQDSIPELTQGISLLNNGAQTLTANNAALVDGASTLASGTSQIVDGVSQLDEGSHTLADGIVEFNEEGIEKIVNAYNGDVKDIVNRLQDVLDAGEAYQSYTEVADGVNGSVKFVYKTAAIKAED